MCFQKKYKDGCSMCTRYLDISFLLRQMVIDNRGMVYRAWSIMIVILCVLTSFFYAILGAFKESYEETLDIVLAMEIIFLIDFLLHFILSFPINPLNPQSQINTNLADIFTNYLQGNLIIDLIPLLPLQYLPLARNGASYFYMLKVIRFLKGLDYLNVGPLMAIIKGY